MREKCNVSHYFGVPPYDTWPIIKNEGSLGDSDAEKGGLLSLTYASPPEWDCPPPPPGVKVGGKIWEESIHVKLLKA